MSFLPAVFLKGTAFSAGAAVLTGLFGYLTRRTMANNLPENDYAFFYSMFALINLLLIFFQAGTSSVLLFELPGMLESGRKRCAGACYSFIKKFQTVNAWGGTLLLLLSFPLLEKYYFDYPVLRKNFYFFMLLIWGFTLENTTLFTLNTLKRFGIMSGLRIVKAGFFLLGACLCFWENGFTWIILCCAVTTTACSIAGDAVILRSRELPCGFKTPSGLKKKIIKSGLVFMLLSGGTSVQQDLGTMTLAFFSSAWEVVLFNIALPLSMIVQSMVVVLNVFNPMITECWAGNDKERLKKLFNCIFLLTAAAMLVAAPVLYFGGELLIKLLFSEKFIAAKWCALFLVEAALLSISVRALFNFFNTAELKNVSLKTLLPMGLAAIVFFPLLSRWFGAAGAGVAALLATAVWFAAYLFYFVRFMKQE